jgi:hypothetical protein
MFTWTNGRDYIMYLDFHSKWGAAALGGERTGHPGAGVLHLLMDFSGKIMMSQAPKDRLQSDF